MEDRSFEQVVLIDNAKYIPDKANRKIAFFDSEGNAVNLSDGGLQGPKGDQGEPGAKGDQGDPGEPGLGSSFTGSGTMSSPFLKDPVQWVAMAPPSWDIGGNLPDPLSTTEQARHTFVGFDAGEGTGATITPAVNGAISNLVYSTAMQALDESNCIVAPGKLCGTRASITSGPQLGDRVVYLNSWTSDIAAIFTITDLGSESTPWVLTIADDFDTVVKRGELAICSVEGTEWWARLSHYAGYTMLNMGKGDLFTYYSVGDTIASARGAMVFGNYSQATEPWSIAFGTGTNAAHYASIVIGNGSRSLKEREVVIGNGAPGNVARIIKGVVLPEYASFTVDIPHLDMYVPCESTDPIVATIGNAFNNLVPVGSEIRLVDSSTGNLSISATGSVVLIGTTAADTAGQILWGTKIDANTWHFVKLT